MTPFWNVLDLLTGVHLDGQRELMAPGTPPITANIDSLRTSDRWLPYVAPLHGGIDARCPRCSAIPAPELATRVAQACSASKNHDQSAEKQFRIMESVGLAPQDSTPWNAYPWYVNRAPSAAELRSATPTLVALLELLPNVEFFLLQGGEA